MVFLVIKSGFSTLLDIDKLTPKELNDFSYMGFSTLLDIDKLTQLSMYATLIARFSTLLDIDKLTPTYAPSDG